MMIGHYEIQVGCDGSQSLLLATRKSANSVLAISGLTKLEALIDLGQISGRLVKSTTY